MLWLGGLLLILFYISLVKSPAPNFNKETTGINRVTQWINSNMYTRWNPQGLTDAMMHKEAVLRGRLTVVITTSPVRSNPSTAMMEDLFRSFEAHCPELAMCDKVIVCDGYNVVQVRNEQQHTVSCPVNMCD